jgi:hypothetical protein
LRDARLERIAAAGNLPPQLPKDGGKEIRDSWRTKGGSRYGMREVLAELFQRKKPPAARNFCGGSSEMTELSRRR